LVIAEGGRITLHRVTELIAFSSSPKERHLMVLNRGDKFIFWVNRMSAYERCGWLLRCSGSHAFVRR